MHDKNILAHLDPRRFELILFPTEQCNFRCTYCYEDFEIGKMHADVVLGVKNLIKTNSEKIKELHLSWFGGEPLLAMNIISDISEYVKTLIGEFNLLGSMTTNGYLLTVDTAKKLIDYHVKDFQISLDGLSDCHDSTRKLVNGNGTFDTIWRNLLALKETDLEFNIVLRLHLTNKNIDSLYELSQNIKNIFLSDSRFSVFVKCIENLGGPYSKNIPSLNDKEKVLQKKKIDDIFTVGAKNIGNQYVCYAAKSNSYVIRADGRVQKCTVALNADHNTLAVLNKDGTFELDKSKLVTWMRGFSYGNSAELACPANNHPSTLPTKDDIQILEILGT